MAEPEKKPVRVMIREAVEALGGRARNRDIRSWVEAHYPGTNDNTVSTQISVHTVNAPSRVNFPENAKPRIANNEQQDFLFRVDRGEVELYEPARHGVWEIAVGEDGGLAVRQVEDSTPTTSTTLLTAWQPLTTRDRLRDYLARNLEFVEVSLEPFTDEEGNSGINYDTPVGQVALLAVDARNRLVVIEVVDGAESDAALAQLLRCRGWVRQSTRTSS